MTEMRAGLRTNPRSGGARGSRVVGLCNWCHSHIFLAGTRGCFPWCLIDPYLVQSLSPDSMAWWNLLSCNPREWAELSGTLLYPCGCLASSLIFWPCSHPFISKARSQPVCGLPPPLIWGPFWKLIVCLARFVSAAFLLDPWTPHLEIDLFLVFRETKLISATGRVVPSACSSPSLPHLHDLPHKGLFPPLVKQVCSPVLCDPWFSFTLFYWLSFSLIATYPFSVSWNSGTVWLINNRILSMYLVIHINYLLDEWVDGWKDGWTWSLSVEFLTNAMYIVFSSCSTQPGSCKFSSPSGIQ